MIIYLNCALCTLFIFIIPSVVSRYPASNVIRNFAEKASFNRKRTSEEVENKHQCLSLHFLGNFKLYPEAFTQTERKILNIQLTQMKKNCLPTYAVDIERIKKNCLPTYTVDIERIKKHKKAQAYVLLHSHNFSGCFQQ